MCIHSYMHTHDSRNMHENTHTHTWCYWDIILAENVSLQTSEWQHDTNLARDWREWFFYPCSTTELYYTSVLPLECLSMPVKQLASMKEKQKSGTIYIYQNKMRCDGNVSLCQSPAATNNNQIVARDEIHPPRHLYFYLVLENICADYPTPHPHCTGILSCFSFFRGQFPYYMHDSLDLQTDCANSSQVWFLVPYLSH